MREVRIRPWVTTKAGEKGEDFKLAGTKDRWTAVFRARNSEANEMAGCTKRNEVTTCYTEQQ